MLKTNASLSSRKGILPKRYSTEKWRNSWRKCTQGQLCIWTYIQDHTSGDTQVRMLRLVVIDTLHHPVYFQLSLHPESLCHDSASLVEVSNWLSLFMCPGCQGVRREKCLPLWALVVEKEFGLHLSLNSSRVRRVLLPGNKESQVSIPAYLFGFLIFNSCSNAWWQWFLLLFLDNLRFLLQTSKICALIYVNVWRRQWHPTPVLLPGKSHGWRSLESCSPRGRWGSDTTERLHFHFALSRIGEGNGNPLQCSCLENPRDRGAWWAAVYGVA